MDPGHEGIKGGVLILTEIVERRIVPSKKRIRRGMAFTLYRTFSTYVFTLYRTFSTYAAFKYASINFV